MKYDGEVRRCYSGYSWEIDITRGVYITSEWTYQTKNSAKQAMRRVAKKLNIEVRILKLKR